MLGFFVVCVHEFTHRHTALSVALLDILRTFATFPTGGVALAFADERLAVVQKDLGINGVRAINHIELFVAGIQRLAHLPQSHTIVEGIAINISGRGDASVIVTVIADQTLKCRTAVCAASCQKEHHQGGGKE